MPPIEGVMLMAEPFLGILLEEFRFWIWSSPCLAKKSRRGTPGCQSDQPKRNGCVPFFLRSTDLPTGATFPNLPGPPVERLE